MLVFPDGFQELCHWHHTPMQRHDLINHQFQLLEVIVQIHTKRIDRGRWRCVRLWRRVNVGFDQKLLFGKISHDQPIMVRVAFDVMKLQHLRAIGQNVFVGYSLDFCLLI